MPITTSTSHGHTHGHPSSAHAPSSTSGVASNAPSTPLAGQAVPAPRVRGQNARKRAAQADDAAYHAAAGIKRAAGDRADGDRERTKRKRVDASAASTESQRNAGNSGHVGEKDDRVSLIDFTAFPTDALHRYLAHFDLIPDLDPSPLTVEDPGPPSSLLKAKSHVPPHGHALRQTSTASPGPVPTGAAANRRRSSRLVEEERFPAPPPVYGDIAEVDGVLAAIAERHFREQEGREGRWCGVAAASGGACTSEAGAGSDGQLGSAGGEGRMAGARFWSSGRALESVGECW